MQQTITTTTTTTKTTTTTTTTTKTAILCEGFNNILFMSVNNSCYLGND